MVGELNMSAIMARQTPDEILYCAFVSALCTFSALFYVYMARNEIRGALFIQPNSLVKTDGIITKSKLQWHHGKSPGYKYEIIYNYAAGGKTYDSDQINFIFGRSGPCSSLANTYVEKYPVGTPVVVHYKIDEPAFAVLEPTVMGDTSRDFAIATALFVISVAFCIGFLCVYQGRNQAPLPNAVETTRPR